MEISLKWKKHLNRERTEQIKTSKLNDGGDEAEGWRRKRRTKQRVNVGGESVNQTGDKWMQHEAFGRWNEKTASWMMMRRKNVNIKEEMRGEKTKCVEKNERWRVRVWRKNDKNRLRGEEEEKEERACWKRTKARRKNDNKNRRREKNSDTRTENKEREKSLDSLWLYIYIYGQRSLG